MPRFILIGILVVALLASLFVTPHLQPLLLKPSLFLPALLLILLLGDTWLALRSAAVGGVVMDLFSAGPFGAYVFAYVTTVVVTRWVFRTKITNRSLLALLSLTGIGSILASLLVMVNSHLGRLIDPRALSVSPTSSWVAVTVTDAFRTMALAVLVYWMIRLFGRRYSSLTAHEF